MDTINLAPLPDIPVGTPQDILFIDLQEVLEDISECRYDLPDEVYTGSGPNVVQKPYEVVISGDITGLVCNYFDVEYISFDNMTTLNVLSVIENHLADISIKGKLSNLMMMFAGKNQLMRLNPSYLPRLQVLGCGGMGTMTELFVGGCPLLMAVNCFDDSLDEDMLEEIFTDLPDRTGAATPGLILCGGTNPGYYTADRTIAHAKNWLTEMPSP